MRITWLAMAIVVAGCASAEAQREFAQADIPGCGAQIGGGAWGVPNSCEPQVSNNNNPVGGGGGSCTNGNLLLVYSDPCQLMSQMVGN